MGQLLGKLALAGIATGGFVLWSILGLTSLVSVGVMAKLARRIGANEIAQAEQIALKGLWYAFTVSLVVGSAIWVLAPSLFTLMGPDPAVRALGEKYLRVILCGCPFIFLSFTVQRIFQSVGDTVSEESFQRSNPSYIRRRYFMFQHGSCVGYVPEKEVETMLKYEWVELEGTRFKVVPKGNQCPCCKRWRLWG